MSADILEECELGLTTFYTVGVDLQPRFVRSFMGRCLFG